MYWNRTNKAGKFCADQVAIGKPVIKNTKSCRLSEIYVTALGRPISCPKTFQFCKENIRID